MIKLTYLFIATGLFLSACGDGRSQSEEETNEKEMTSAEILQQQQNEAKGQDEARDQDKEATENTESSEQGQVVEVTITGNDQMQYNKDEIRVKAGSTVKLTLKHVGEMTLQQMGHNWVLLTQNTDKMKFAQKAATAQDSGYIPPAEENNVIVHTKMLGGGEEDTITFEAPEKGTYEFICSFPGHVAVMNGKFIVE